MNSMKISPIIKTLLKSLLVSLVIVLNANIVCGLLSQNYDNIVAVGRPEALADHVFSNSSAQHLADGYETIEDLTSVVIIRELNEKLSQNVGKSDSKLSTDLSLISQQIIMLLVVKILLL